jgi:hypothetical protein
MQVVETCLLHDQQQATHNVPSKAFKHKQLCDKITSQQNKAHDLFRGIHTPLDMATPHFSEL